MRRQPPGQRRRDQPTGSGNHRQHSLANCRPTRREDRLTPGSARSGRTHVLVVDDEDGVLDVTAQGLRAEGYHVSTCNNPSEAVELYRDDHEHIDLVIVDMVMPDMSGIELLEKIREIDPGVPVVLSSGFVLDEMVEEFMTHGFVGFLTKPFKMEELLDVVGMSLSDQRPEQGAKKINDPHGG